MSTPNFDTVLATEAADDSVPITPPRRSSLQYNNVVEKVVSVADCGTFVGNAGIVIEECLQVILDPGSKKRERAGAHKSMEELSLKMQATAPIIVSTVATANKKVKGGKKALQKIQQEDRRKRSRFQSAAAKKKSDALLAVELFDPAKKGDTYAAAWDALKENSTPSGPPERRISPRSSPIPAPPNGVEYDRVQTWNILRKCEDKKGLKLAKDAMYPDGEPPYVPITRSQLNKFWKKHKDWSTPPYPASWGRNGRPTFMSVAKLTKQLIDRLEGYEDNSVGREDFVEIITAARKETIRSRGEDPRGQDLSISDETIDAYITAVQGTAGVKLSENVREKTKRRRDAEVSIRNSTTQLFASAVAQSIALSGAVPADRKLQENTSTGAKDLYSLVQKAEGTDNICPVDPHLLTSKDELGFHAAFGADDRVTDLRMTLKTSSGKTHAVHRSVKAGDDSSSNKFKGATVCGYTLTTGAGQMAPILLTTKRLSPSELPADKCPQGFVIIPVQYLGAGGDTDPYNVSIGYVAFIREDKNIEVDLFKDYFERIHAPFLRQIRTNAGLSPDHTTCPPMMRSVNMQDGGMSGLFATTSE